MLSSVLTFFRFSVVILIIMICFV
uniref:Uncharacterized protein n=1 Tax=Anguilla anguilla TaxID=7936 RepID=A0A0E9S7N5_ANGAN